MESDCKQNVKREHAINKEQDLSREDTFHLGAKVIIKNNDGKILVLKCDKKTKSYWDLPGGRIHVGSTLEETAQREVAEETGIADLANVHFLGMVPPTVRATLSSGLNIGIIYAFFEATVNQVTVTLSHEHQGYEWVTADEAVKRVGYMGATSFLLQE